MDDSKHNSSKPLVSVIVLTYCQENTIARTLDSILSQHTDFAFEIVIGEDASTDGTRAVCESYVRRYPDVVRLMPKADNKGLVRNYIDTLLQCRGDFIADCAGDDFWCDNNKLQKQADILTKCPDVSVVHTAWYNYNHDTGTKTYIDTLHTSSDEYVRRMALQEDQPIIHLSTTLFRKDIVLDAIKEAPDFFFSDNIPCEDLQITYFLAKAGKVAYIPQPTLCYSIGQESLSSTHDKLKFIRFYLYAADLHHRIIRREQLSGDDVNRYFQTRICILLRRILWANVPFMLNEVEVYAKQWQQPLSLKNRLLAFCVRTKALRSTLRALRRIIK
ncbi:MAG: glycosyltransferase [Muribaculaceae bacterium]|nr:glycosyltransferase [Muribaculaceae bacterium]